MALSEEHGIEAEERGLSRNAGAWPEVTHRKSIKANLHRKKNKNKNTAGNLFCEKRHVDVTTSIKECQIHHRFVLYLPLAGLRRPS